MPPSERAPGPVTPRPSELPVSTLPGIGPAGARALAERGVRTVGDLLYLLPRRYDDERRPTPLTDLEAGRHAVVLGRVAGVRRAGPPGRGARLEVSIEPGPGEAQGRVAVLRLVWFRAPGGLAARFRRGALVRATGKVEAFRGFLQMAHPETEFPGDDGDASAGRIRVRYPEVPGVAPRILERAVAAAVARTAEDVPDLLPTWLREAQGLPSIGAALRRLHAPAPDLDEAELDRLNEARTAEHARLALEELFLMQVVMRRRRARHDEERAAPLVAGPATVERARGALPFPLTGAQARVVDEIVADLARDRPMRRLLQGDVGSGKTAVAFLAAAHAVTAGAQVAFMVPTEILAEQQLRTFHGLGKALGLRVALVVGGARSSHRKKVRAQLEDGTLDVVVGTHALLTEGVEFRKLGLVIVDEQHRFGVAQRLRLVEKGGGAAPHLLVMTATPIPRSLALAVHGDLDVSVLDEMPPGRVPPVTRAFPRARRERALHQLRRALDAGGQVYVVCPAVEESEELDLRAALEVHAELSERFADCGVELVHGRQGTEERQTAMARFAAGEARVLVSTTVIEVGVDVPSANAILIEDAERFGLAQLHQLRGRVGRAGQRSACLLVHRAAGDGAARERIDVLCESADGFRIAEKDLELRKEGDLLGRRQSGLPGLRFADLRRDLPILERAQGLAQALLDEDPRLERPGHASIRRSVEAVEAAREVVGVEAG